MFHSLAEYIYLFAEFFVMKQASVFISALLFFAACNTFSKVDGDVGQELLDEKVLAGDIKILASDSFLGRKPFTEGEVKTTAFLAQRFREIGAEPGNGASYFQEVPMVEIATVAAPTMRVKSPAGEADLKGFDDYVIWTEKTDPVIRLKDAELVFAGYGVVAPEYNWNDYAGIDVKGKIVMVLVNDPGYGIDSSLFKGDTMTYYGRWTYKFEEAARQGAKGCLVIHNTQAASYPFSVVQNNWNGSRLRLDTKLNSYCDVVGWLSEAAAEKLLSWAGYSSSVLKQAAVKGFRGVDLKTKLTTSMSVKTTYNTSKNVIAKITGTKKPDEYIIYSAHWDHLGVGKPDDTGDSIYNGALDNATGTAGLLQLATAFMKAAQKPERTIVFLAVTAEEQGLWGSNYYANHPVYPLKKTVANINMDVLNNKGKTKDVVVVGKGQSDLEDYLEETAKELNRRVGFETNPASGAYYRSDHFNFAKVGVPSLYMGSGRVLLDSTKASQREDYVKNHYHRPSDEYNDSWNLEGAADDLKLLYLLGRKLANSNAWPVWKTGSEFKKIRER